jgi:hypothetical protein
LGVAARLVRSNGRLHGWTALGPAATHTGGMLPVRSLLMHSQARTRTWPALLVSALSFCLGFSSFSILISFVEVKYNSISEENIIY